MTDVTTVELTPQDKCIERKKRMIELRLSVTSLAQHIGCSRNSVSQAINHDLHSGVRNEVDRILGLSWNA